MVPPVQLILKMDLFALNDRITDKCPAVQIFPFHVNCGDLMIFRKWCSSRCPWWHCSRMCRV